MKLIWYFILLIYSASSFAQSVVIRGNVFDYDTGEPLFGVAISLDNDNGTITDDNGKFCFKVHNIKAKDKLRVGFINYFELKFVNLPIENDTINLNNIPLFYYFPTELDPISIFCRRSDLICKWNRRKQMKVEEKRLEPYYIKRDRIIKSYNYIFGENLYLINVDDHIINLKNNK